MSGALQQSLLWQTLGRWGEQRGWRGWNTGTAGSLCRRSTEAVAFCWSFKAVSISQESLSAFFAERLPFSFLLSKRAWVWVPKLPAHSVLSTPPVPLVPSVPSSVPQRWRLCCSRCACCSCVELVLGKEQGLPALPWLCLREAGEYRAVHTTQGGFGVLDRVSVKLCYALPRSPHHQLIENKSHKSHPAEGLVLWIWVCTSKDRVSMSWTNAGICELSPHQPSGSKFSKASFFKSTPEHLLSFVDLFL